MGVYVDNDGVLRRHLRGGLIVFVFLMSAGATAHAEPPLYVDDAPHAELFTGFDASNNAAGGYVGAGYAFGNGLYESGWRLRAVGAFGRYHYDGSLPSHGVQVPTNFDGEDTYGAALIGYQLRRQSLFLKVFAGVEAEDRHIVPHDPNNSVQGRTETAGRELARLFPAHLLFRSMRPTAAPSRNIGRLRVPATD